MICAEFERMEEGYRVDAACMAYGNKLSEIAKEIPNEPKIVDLLSKKANESWNMAIKITNYLNN